MIRTFFGHFEAAKHNKYWGFGVRAEKTRSRSPTKKNPQNMAEIIKHSNILDFLYLFFAQFLSWGRFLLLWGPSY